MGWLVILFLGLLVAEKEGLLAALRTAISAPRNSFGRQAASVVGGRGRPQVSAIRAIEPSAVASHASKLPSFKFGSGSLFTGVGSNPPARQHGKFSVGIGL